MAWNDSAKGVINSSLTVGIIIHASEFNAA
jgi:hypothetical protein